MGCMGMGRQPALYCTSTSLQTALIFIYSHSSLAGNGYKKIVCGTVFQWSNCLKTGDLRGVGIYGILEMEY